MAIRTESGAPAVASWLRAFARPGRVGGRLTVLLALAGPVFALATAIAIGGRAEEATSPDAVRYILLADLVYIIIVAGLIALRVGRLIAARRAHSAGAQLHTRLLGVFALVALAPTVAVAVFATLTLNFGLESWFSDQVRTVVRNSLVAAEAYEREHRRNISGDVLQIANDLNRAGAVGMEPAALGDLLRARASASKLTEAYLIDSEFEIVARGEFSYAFTFEQPSELEIARARGGEVVIIEDEKGGEIRALVNLNSFLDLFLYVSRPVEGEVLELLDETRRKVERYEELESIRASVLLDYALYYIGFALLVVMAAAWLALWFAERLARPIGALAGAAQQVGEGDLDVRVPEPQGEDEVALLSRVFNRMTSRVKRQRDELVAANRETERRRNFIETVLSGVSAGVIGLDSGGHIEMVNQAAAEMLGLDAQAVGRRVATVAPALQSVVERAQGGVGSAHEQLAMEVGGAPREFLARVSPRSSKDAGEGYVLTLDDMTALVSAQRQAAWGDVARRVAHEIKNPLTPIQLSAERLRRKFGKLAGDDRKTFDQYADVIVRQAGDIRRMVDEFSRFARMPAPEARPCDVGEILREAAMLQRAARPDIEFNVATPPAAVIPCDRSMLSQAFTNLIKNAIESIDAHKEKLNHGNVECCLALDERALRVEIADNGVGLPREGRERLLEPYVTHRDKGTGLGLAIVKKIVEQHGGLLTLGDATEARGGAVARVTLPLTGVGGAGGETEGEP